MALGDAEYKLIRRWMVLALALGLFLAEIGAYLIYPLETGGGFAWTRHILVFLVLAIILVPLLFRLTARLLVRAGKIDPNDIPDSHPDVRHERVD